ncbi:MAG: methyltransferase domain-containing protein [Lachnospiraceae bacterium]|nr:methyltransferase domain-containing protein [Lachnospiraceae bacterium]
MQNQDIKEYLARTGIVKISRLDTALLEAFGEEEGGRHIERLDELFGRSEERLLYGTGDTIYLHRQEELVEYLNQNLRMSLLAASFYDRVFFKRAAEYLLKQDSFFAGDIFDMGCGNGILTCFLALQHPDSSVTGLDLSPGAVRVARELAGKIELQNVRFMPTGETICEHEDAAPQELPGMCDTLFSCRTAHENAAWRPLCEEAGGAALSAKEQERRHGQYAQVLSALLKPRGYLVSVERYEDDSAYEGLLHALERQEIWQVKGTHMQFSCKSGDGTGTFQAAVFQKIPT